MDGERVALVEVDARVSVRPVWAPCAVASAICGMPRNVIREWVANHEVRAKKLDASSQNSTVVYRVDDLLEKVDTLSDVKIGDESKDEKKGS